VASGEKKSKRDAASPKKDSGRANLPASPPARPRLDEEREDFIVRGSVVETPEGFKLRF